CPAHRYNNHYAHFHAAMMHGSEHNDCYIDELGTTETNHAGGLSGGMTNGNPLIFRVAVKPTSSTSKEQKTFNFKSKKIESLKIEGRHDLCIALRVPPVIEAVTAIVFADLLMIHNSKKM
ncbi:MAG TPA: chorismate synthase, partial [Saprospiraceae bacterium]|nr:chorismate synthase [Saprospiraceae bacterium]